MKTSGISEKEAGKHTTSYFLHFLLGAKKKHKKREHCINSAPGSFRS